MLEILQAELSSKFLFFFQLTTMKLYDVIIHVITTLSLNRNVISHNLLNRGYVFSDLQ